MVVVASAFCALYADDVFLVPTGIPSCTPKIQRAFVSTKFLIDDITGKGWY
jgi:hypothetical protein